MLRLFSELSVSLSTRHLTRQAVCGSKRVQIKCGLGIAVFCYRLQSHSLQQNILTIPLRSVKEMIQG